MIETHNAKQVEASGPNGLQATSSMLAQRSLTLPVTSQSQAPLQIKACGQQWIWRYEYPDGTFSYYKLVVPVDTTVILNLCSTDVVHRWWVPDLGGKFDATPVRATRPGSAPMRRATTTARATPSRAPPTR